MGMFVILHNSCTRKHRFLLEVTVYSVACREVGKGKEAAENGSAQGCLHWLWVESCIPVRVVLSEMV